MSPSDDADKADDPDPLDRRNAPRQASPTSTPEAQSQPASSQGSALATLPDLTVTVSILSPHMSAYGERAVFHWFGPRSAFIRVEYGPTSALGLAAAEEPESFDSAADQIAARKESVQHEVALDGLTTGTTYYYRATMLESTETLSQLDLASFQTARVSISVKPVKIDVIKDGDTDIDNPLTYGMDTNKGEARYSWTARLDPQSAVWPDMDALKGCYPGGGSISFGTPDVIKIPIPGVGVDTDNPEGTTHNPNTPQDTDPTAPADPSSTVSACVDEDQSSPYTNASPKTTKVKSGEEIALEEPSITWAIPDGYPLTPVGVSSASTAKGSAANAVTRARPAGGGPPTKAGEEGDVEDDPTGPSGGGGGSSPEPTCEERTPRGAFVAVYLTGRGYEYDKIPNPQTGGDDYQVHRSFARDTDVVCFDLRASDESTMVDVRAADGNFEFRLWFEVALVYGRE